ncbi:MAG: hypothetical protein NTX44_15525 [Ignavibacteriales bacterium]|nr:hypothetical protein [Ignavibacteriales bacterium]
MLPERELNHQASKFKTLLLNADDSEILAHADELLLFLNRLRNISRRNLKVQTHLRSIDDIMYGLESNPEVTLHDKSVLARLLNRFMRFSLH